MPGLPNYIEGFRGIRIDGEWEYSLLTWEEVQELDTEFFRKAFKEYTRHKNYKCLPYSGGYNEQRNTIIEIFEILDSEQHAYNEWERERSK